MAKSKSVSRDVDAAHDEDDPRTGIELLPAEGSDGYVLWIRTAESTRRYALTYDQGGHVLAAMTRAFRQAVWERDVS